MIEIESGDVVFMRDESFGDILDEINGKQRQARMSIIFPCLTALAGLGAVYARLENLGLFIGSLSLIAWLIGLWVDSYRRATVLFYDLTEDTQRAFQDVTVSFDGLMSCSAKWHIEAGGIVKDLNTWKRNAGASHLVRRKPTKLVYKLPKIIKSNVVPPALHVGRQVIYFFPDIALIEDGNRFGAVGYKDLKLSYQDSNFIEEGMVPSDAEVISYTWKHPNKKGGPDRRFRNNKQIPVCQYEAMHISSASGISELVEFSRTGVSSVFARTIKRLPKQSVSELLLSSAQ